MHTQPTKGDQSNSRTILVVEDDAFIGELLTLAISQETPFKALLALDGFEALQLVHEYKPSLFILDYHLPDMNGIALYDRLHALNELASTPALLISANVPQRELAKRSLTGMRKPFDLNVNFGIPWAESVQFYGRFSLSLSAFTFPLKRSPSQSKAFLYGKDAVALAHRIVQIPPME